MPNETVTTHSRSLGFAACTLAGMFWGCGFFFGKIALAEMNSGAMVLYRFLFAALGLAPLLLTHRPHLNRREWGILLVASLLGVPLQFLFQFHGLALTTVSHAALMVGTMPVILAVGATFFAHERLHALGWIALVVSTAGAALIALGQHETSASGPTLRGDLFVVFSLSIALFWVLLNQRLVIDGHSPVVITAYGLCAGTVMLLLIVPFLYGLPPIHHISLKVWLALAASGLLCTASSTLLWNYGMARVPASQAGVLLNMEPLIGSLLGVFVLHEVLGPLALLGGALILAAAITLTTHHPRTEPHTDPLTL
jgi:drug/metabolite transporter (DMT)-like permease